MPALHDRDVSRAKTELLRQAFVGTLVRIPKPYYYVVEKLEKKFIVIATLHKTSRNYKIIYILVCQVD